MTRLENVMAIANELAEAICEGPTRDEQATLWRYARAHVELRMTLAAGEPVADAGHSVHVDALGERGEDSGADGQPPLGLAPGNGTAGPTVGAPSRSPSALSGRDGDLIGAADGPPDSVVAYPGHTGPSRPPNAPDDDPTVRRLHVIQDGGDA